MNCCIHTYVCMFAFGNNVECCSLPNRLKTRVKMTTSSNAIPMLLWMFASQPVTLWPLNLRGYMLRLCNSACVGLIPRPLLFLGLCMPFLMLRWIRGNPFKWGEQCPRKKKLLPGSGQGGGLVSPPVTVDTGTNGENYILWRHRPSYGALEEAWLICVGAA